MAKRESSPGISPAKKRTRYRSGSNFNAEYTRTFDWVMASDRGKQQAYCKVCSKHFTVSHGGIYNVRSHGEGKMHLELFNGFLKKKTDFPRVVPHFFFRNLTCLNKNTAQYFPIHIMLKMHGWKFKIYKILNSRNSNFKACRMSTKMDNFKLKWLIVFR